MLTRVLFTVVLIAGTALRFYGLGSESFWQDESWTWHIVSGSIGRLFDRLIHSDAHPPLYYLILWPVSRFADGEVALRAPSAILGVASLALIFRLGRSVDGPRGGLAAMALLAVAPFHIKYCQEARAYSLFFFLCLVSLNLVVALHGQPRRSLWIGLAATTALILYTEYLGIFFLLGQAALVLFRSRSFVGKALLAGAGAAVLYLPWAPTAYRHLFMVAGGFWQPFATPHRVAEQMKELLAYPYGVSATLGVLCCLPLVLLLLAAPRLMQRRDIVPWQIAAVLPVVSMIVAGLFLRIFCARGLIFTLAPLCLLAGIAVTRLPWPAATATLLVALLAGVPGMRFLHGFEEKEQWREAAAFLLARARPGAVVLAHEGYLDVNLEYYWRNNSDPPPLVTVEDGGRNGPGLSREAAAEKVKNASEVWLVRRTYADRPEMIPLLERHFPRQETFSWRYVGAVRFRR